MAWQHLFARVPAKVSMFNKTDGYDTFACSEEITRDFAEKELVYVCDIKLTSEDADKIHANKLSPVYCQFMCHEGELVQSCITYLPSDYSGERSTYMVHSFVMPKEEHAAFFRNYDNSAFNKSCFLHDLESFNITNPSSKADHRYPSLDYKGELCESPEWMTEAFNRDMMRRFIYAVLNAICGKFKSVYVLLKDTGEESSNEFERLINSLFKVLPYHLRPLLSFATRVNNTSQLTATKLKGIVADPKILKTPKCAVFEFSSMFYNGIKDDDVNANLTTIDFLYSLFKNDMLRRDFLAFADHAVSILPELGSASLSNISELVYMFRCGCGYYDEKVVLPNDDKVLDMLSYYEKYRKAIPDEYRVIMMRCVNRYPAARVEIPKKIFSKIQKLYPKEIIGTKHVIMNAILDLIHTDTMREKLFSFIKSNYNSEDNETKLNIIKHVCNVLYGGFLQSPILDFLKECYPKCPAEGKDEILSKILLVIRTKALLEQIMAFFNELYDVFDDKSRALIYDTVIEQLPEGDELALNLVSFVDAHIESEPESFREDFDSRLIKLVLSEQNRAKHPLLEMLGTTAGHCSALIAGKVFTEWSGRKILYEYIGILINGDFASQLRCIDQLSQFVSVVCEDAVAKMSDTVAEKMLVEDVKVSLSELINAAETYEKSGSDFLRQISEKALSPLAANQLYGVFSSADDNMTVEHVVHFASEHPVVSSSEKFAVLVTYLNFKKCVAFGDIVNLFKYCEDFPADKILRKNIGVFAEKEFSNRINTAHIPSFASFRFAFSYLKTGSFHVDECFSLLLPESSDSAPQPDNAEKKLSVADNLLDVCWAIAINPSYSEDFKALLTADNSGIDQMLEQLVTSYGSKAVKHFDEKLAKYNAPHNDFVTYCKGIIHRKRPGTGFMASVTGIFSKVAAFFKSLPEKIKRLFKKQ